MYISKGKRGVFFIIAAGLTGALVPMAVALAAPVPPRPATPHGIVLFTWETRHVLFLNEDGRIVRRYDVRKLAGKGWRPVAVSPDGTRLAVVELQSSLNARPTYQLRIIPLVGDSRPADLPHATPADRGFVWSGDRKELVGTRSVFDLLDSHTRNIHIDLETGDWYDLPLMVRRDADKQYPVTRHAVFDWSADGEWFLTGERPGTDARQLFLVSRDGRGCRPLTDNADVIRQARFSPDGSAVLFSRSTQGRPHLTWGIEVSRGLYTLKVAGGEPTRIAALPESGLDSLTFAWRPDGKRVAYTQSKDILIGRHRGPQGVVTCDPDGGNPNVLKISPELGGFTIHAWR